MTMLQYSHNPNRWLNTNMVLGWVYDEHGIAVSLNSSPIQRVIIRNPEIAEHINKLLCVQCGHIPLGKVGQDDDQAG